MTLTILAIGYILLAMSDICPRFIKNENVAATVSFYCAVTALVIFISALVNNTYFNQ